MRKLGPVENVLRATMNLDSRKTPSLWEKIWNERDVQIMVLISLALQIFLLFAGNVRRRCRVGWLRVLVWLAYLAAYTASASAIGLFSQYEDKYKLRSLESFEHLYTLTMPFLWPPFLLLHLGGPDTITAFSIEDNNLWMRQLINLMFQLSLALYVFWKSLDLLDWELLKVAVPLFVAGIIKYGERIWALQGGCPDSLDYPNYLAEKYYRNPPIRTQLQPGDVVACCALHSALSARRILAGRALEHLNGGAQFEIMAAFGDTDPTEGKLKIVLTELGMIYDMLYTKTMVLLSWKGGVFRCVALIAMVVAFVLFWVNQHLHAHKTTNAAITYTLFVAAIFVEVYSILMVIASPWTRARSKQGTFLCWLSRKLACCFPSQGLSSSSMSQFNLTDYSLSKKSIPKFISEIFEALGLEKHWRNFWHVKHVEDKLIVDYIVGLFNTDPNRSGEQSRHLKLGRKLKEVISQPFEYALFELHIMTEMHLSTDYLLGGDGSGEMTVLVAECRKLSNYLMYLMAVYPSMLPVSSTARDIGPHFAEWVRNNCGNLTKAEILRKYKKDDILGRRYESPFGETPSEESLKEIKEVWARVLIYVAGKFPMEHHARLLANGVELLTVVGSLMMHQYLGDTGEEFGLVAPPGHVPSERYSLQPLYAFEFLHDHNQMPTSILPLSRMGGSLRAELNVLAPSPIPGLSAPTQVTAEPSTSRGTNVALEIEQAGGHPVAELMGRSLSAREVVRPPRGQLTRASSI